MIAALGVAALVAVVAGVVCGWTHLPAAGITLHPKPKRQPPSERPVPSWAVQ